MEASNENLWNECLEGIRVSVSPAIFSTWFTQTHIVSVKRASGRTIVEIGCNSSFVKATIESRYFGLVADVLTKQVGEACDLVFTVDPMQNTNTIDSGPLFQDPGEDSVEKLERAHIRKRFTFENFAVSTTNQMAFAAAEAVVQNPGAAYNPLFIWGGVGVGKTHLMNAIGHDLVTKSGNNVLFCTGEEFTNDIVEGIRNRSTNLFRDKYRKLDGLIIDDIQFIAGKDAVQEEFFHTFNALAGLGRQIILASDRPPSEIAKLEERLRSRFEAGLIVDIAPPDYELRCAIVQIKAREKGLKIDDSVVHLIASNIDSARKLEGFLITLISQPNLIPGEITTESVTKLLGKKTEGETSTRLVPTDVVNVVAKYFSVGKRELLGASRAKPIAVPRQILMYLLRTSLSLPYQEVGRVLGGRDHTTIMHGVEKITLLSTTDVKIREDILGIKNLL